MTIPAHPYFCLKSGEHDVTLTSFTTDLSEPWKIPLVRMCKLMTEGVCKVWWRYLISFFNYGIGKKSGWPFYPHTFGARAK